MIQEQNIKKSEQTTSRKSIKNNEITYSGNNNNNYSKKRKCKKILLLTISIPILLALIIAIYFLFIKSFINDERNKEKDPFAVITPEYKIGSEKLESEFEFKTLVGDLRRIEIIQKSDEDRLYEGKKIKRAKIRKTIYYKPLYKPSL